jgi:PKD repeat protein
MDDDTVKVNVFPLPTDILGPDVTACDSVTLNASGGVSYQWQDGSSGSTHKVIATGTYAVTATDINGCSNSAEINVTINESAQAGFSFDTTNCPDVSFANLSSGTSPLYFWDFGDGTGSSTTHSPSHTFGSNGLYVVELTASNMCDTNSVSDTVGIDCYPDGIVNPKRSNWRIYPNPASTVLYLEYLQPTNYQTEVSVTSTIGQQLLKKKLNGAIVGLNIQHLPVGMYFLELIHNGETQVLPVSIIR